ncbi:MAG: galactokinase [Acidimicrobiales bacterium]
MRVEAFAPGRVNLMGDHTDHTGGLVLPIAIDLGTTVRGEREGDVVRLTSVAASEPAVVPLDVGDPSTVAPGWARYVAGVVSELRPATGFTGDVDTTLPIGAGLSSSAALEVAVALALGFEGDTRALARLCQRAEQRASGVPCGIMDQLACAAGVAGHALRIDCTTLDVRPVEMPDDLEVVVVDSGQRRELATSAYAERAAACEAATVELGPLSEATVDDLDRLEDPVVRRRARHVITENARVDAVAAALARGDRAGLGEAMAASHASLRDDFEVSTPLLDELVMTLASTPGVVGARLTGAGFGGCAVALVDRGARLDLRSRHWPVRAASGATADRS